MDTAKTAPPGGGFAPINRDVVVTNRSGGALAVGDVVEFDLDTAASDEAETTTTLPYTAEGTSAYNNVVAPTATGFVDGGCAGAVVLEAIADNATGLVRLEGVVQAFVIAASGSPIPRSLLVPTTSKNLDLVHAAGEALVARCLEDVATPTTRTLAWVEFHGITPLGFQET